MSHRKLKRVNTILSWWKPISLGENSPIECAGQDVRRLLFSIARCAWDTCESANIDEVGWWMEIIANRQTRETRRSNYSCMMRHEDETAKNFRIRYHRESFGSDELSQAGGSLAWTWSVAAANPWVAGSPSAIKGDVARLPAPPMTRKKFFDGDSWQSLQ